MDTIVICENEKSKCEDLSEADMHYLDKYFSNNLEITWQKEVKNRGSFVGVIELESQRLNFYSKKLDSNFFYMLSYLNDLDSFIYDHNKLIEIEAGNLFFDVIARIFVNEFKEIIKRGLLKKYVEYEENCTYAKGKILINKQIANNFANQSKFYCAYDDLTYDNLENQIILYAAKCLSQLVRNRPLKKDLAFIQNYLIDEVALVDIEPSVFQHITCNRISGYYQKILKISEHIIKRVFSHDINPGKGICFNFLVNMNKVYESFITNMLSDVLMEDFKVKTKMQNSIQRLVREGKRFNQRPDLIIEHNQQTLIIMDIKYKVNKIPASDFYQILSYNLAIPSAKCGILLYEDLSAELSYSRVPQSLDDPDSKLIDIYYQKLKLGEVLSENYNTLREFEENVRLHIRTSELYNLIKPIIEKEINNVN